MATITAAVKQALESKSISYNLKFFIQDNGGNWVDFTDFAQYKGRNQLRKLGSISYSVERIRGQLQQRISSVMLDNPNGFWDRPFPNNLVPSYDSQWRPLPSAGNAQFTTTPGGKESIIYRHKAAVRIEIMATGERVPVVHTVGVFLIDGLETNTSDQSATMTFAPLSAPLVEASAEKLKKGSAWYQDASVDFLVRRLLGDTYKDPNTMELPPQYDISVPPSVSSPITGIEGWEASRLGTPLAKTISHSGLTTEWRDEKFAIRAMCMWEYSTGTITADPTSQSITGSSTLWNATPSDQTKFIRVDDTIVIPKMREAGDGGSAYGNDGYYTVISVDSQTSITLDRPVSGSQAESGLSYAVQRMIVGSGSNVYEYNIAMDTYHQATTGETQLGGSGSRYQVRRLWFNTSDSDYPIWGAAIKTPDMDTTTYTGYSLKIFRMKWNAVGEDIAHTVEAWGTVDTSGDGYTFDLCDYIVRNGEWATGYNYLGQQVKWCHIGGFLHNDDTIPYIQQSPISLPFAQEIQVVGGPCSISHYGKSPDSPSTDQCRYLTSWRDTDDGEGIHIEYRNGGVPATFLRYDDAYVVGGTGTQASFEDSRPRLNQGYYGAFCPGTGLNNNTAPTLMLRYTFGQRGFLELSTAMGTNGKLCFAMVKEPSRDTDSDPETQTYRATRYYWVDLSQSSPGGGAATISAMSSALNSDFDVSSSIPTAVSFNHSGDIYIGTYREKMGTYSGNVLLNARTMLLKMSTSNVVSRLVDDVQWTNTTLRETVITEIVPTTYNNAEAVYTTSTHLDRIIRYGDAEGGTYSVDLWTSSLADSVCSDLNDAGTLESHTSLGGHILPWVYELYDSDLPLWGLAQTNIGDAASDERIVFINGGNGNVMAFPLSQQVQGYQPAVIGTNSTTYGEAGCFAGPIWSSATGEAYWITAPNLARLALPKVSGLYALCRFSWMISTNVMLADFTGMSAWDAIRFLADKSDSVFGFDPDGNFFFRPKPRTQMPAYVFSTDNNQTIMYAVKDRGISELVNYAEASPSVMRFGDAETSIQIVDKSEYGDEKHANGVVHSVNAHSVDTFSHSITLTCAVPGVVQYSETPTTGAQTRNQAVETVDRTFARFRYRVEDAYIESYLSDTLETNEYTVSLGDDFQIPYKSRIHIVNINQDTQAQKTTNLYVGLPMSIGSTQVTVASDAKARDYYISLNTGATADLDTALDYTNAKLQVNDVLMIANSTTMDDIEYVRVCEINRADSVIGVERGCQGNPSPTGHAAASGVWLIKNGASVFCWSPASSQFEKGDQVTVYPPSYGLSSAQFTNIPLDDLSGLSPEQYFKPILNKYVPIGGDRTAYYTGVSLQFTVPPGITSAENDKMKFSYGDIVYVKIPGFTAEADSGARQLAANQASIARYGKRESQLPANPFLSLQQARWWVNREVAQDKDPHCILTIKTIWAPWIYPLDIVNVQSSELFPSSVGHTESFSILEMAYSLQEQPTMTLKLRAVNPY